ncbi:MAG: hypothetical protein M3R27_12030 [Bacteroidota bacterium]|nr:hypothetical protein [Bacteroidota bacterium]
MSIYRQLYKKTAIYALICIYSFALIRPIVPVVNDLVAHVFYKMEHMSTIHFENGQYHIHSELKESSEKTPLSSKRTFSGEKLSFHFFAGTPVIFFERTTKLPILCAKINFPVDVCLKSPTPPPKA